MPKGKKSEFKLGEWIYFDRILLRTRSINSEGKIVKHWQRGIRFAKPKEGVFLGFRTLQNGIVEYDGDGNASFFPKEHIRTCLIAYHPRMKPVYCLLENVRGESLFPEWQKGYGAPK